MGEAEGPQCREALWCLFRSFIHQRRPLYPEFRHLLPPPHPHRQPAAGTDWGAGRMHLQSTPRRGDPSLVYANWKAVKAFFSIAQFLNASITLV